MKAILVHNHGGPEAMVVEEAPTPAPGAGQALVKVEAAGVNFIDIYQRSGAYKVPLPAILGMEGAGVVDAVGEGVPDVKAGDRVAWAMHMGAYTSHAVVPAGRLVPVPHAMSLSDAAAAMLQGMTAHFLATTTYPLKPGDTCLVHAAAGGVGLLLCQIAKLRGARVIGTAGSAEKAALAKEAGAEEVILYRDQDFAAAVKELTGGKGLDVVYDGVGKDTFDQSLNCLHPRGMMVLFGQASGAVPPVDPQTLNAKGSLFLTRPSLGHYSADRTELLERSSDLFDWITSGRLQVHVDRTYPLEEAGAAHTALASRQTVGKVLLAP